MIVIPMAGLSSRFFKAGYQEPKYMLPAHGKPLFDHALLSFSRYFATTPFLFIVRDVYNTPEFVEKRCRQLGIKDYRIVSLTEATRGQAETVYLGLTDVDPQTPLTIFNIDTFRPGFSFPAITEHCDGYLEVFKGEGSNWSYAKPAAVNSTLVVETAEKSRFPICAVQVCITSAMPPIFAQPIPRRPPSQPASGKSRSCI